jgi:hypothetical protein
MDMIASFFTGTLRSRSGESLDAVWARTPFGAMVWVRGDEQAAVVQNIDIIREDLVTTCELPGLDREGLETLVSNILTRGYLERPGVHGKDEAVLFLLVNEAIHILEEIARKEGL